MKYEEAIDILTYQALILGRASGKPTLERIRIEAICKAVEALKKQIPKKPIEKFAFSDDIDAGLCPLCNEGVNEEMNFCSYCGQAIDWEVMTNDTR